MPLLYREQSVHEHGLATDPALRVCVRCVRCARAHPSHILRIPCTSRSKIENRKSALLNPISNQPKTTHSRSGDIYSVLYTHLLSLIFVQDRPGPAFVTLTVLAHHGCWRGEHGCFLVLYINILSSSSCRASGVCASGRVECAVRLQGWTTTPQGAT